MNILILGGGGLVGHKLGQALARRGHLRGRDITSVTLADLTDPAPVAGDNILTERCDITDPAALARVITDQTDVVYLLAAALSAHCEAEFETGMEINMMGVLGVLERCRALGHSPVLVFSSSIATYGGEVPDPVTDASYQNPQTSYGTQKAVGELLINDYSRRGFIDGRSFRLPTISVRPGKPNLAASAFMSSIIREPLAGLPANCPVSRDFPHYYLSPRRCVGNLILGAELAAADLGQNRAMIMPGLRATIAEMIAALTTVAGPDPARLIQWQPQPEIEKIVTGWRFDFRPEKALRLGLRADDSFEDNVRFYMEDRHARLSVLTGPLSVSRG